MIETSLITRPRVRLVSTLPGCDVASGPRCGPIFRPLVVGPAILYRPPLGMDARAAWRVDVLPGHQLIPVAPRRAADVDRVVQWRRAEGLVCRAGAALVSCCDMAPPGFAEPGLTRRFTIAPQRPTRRAATDIYGWALLYRLPGGDPLIDAHDEFDDLPAFYVSAAEAADRAEYLAARGIASRPIALCTMDFDFIAGPTPRNRFFPDSVFHTTTDLRRLF